MSETPAGSALLVADLRRYESLLKSNAEVATKVAALLQQYLGEAVYLFDGKIVDPFGNKVVARMPDVDAAIRAALRAKADVLDHNRQHPAESLDIRFVVHYGEAQEIGMAVRGSGVDEAMTVLSIVEPLHVIVTPDAMTRTSQPWDMHESLGMMEVVGQKKPAPVAPTEAAGHAPGHAPHTAAPTVQAPRSRWTAIVIVAAVVVLLAIIGGGVVHILRNKAEAARAADAQRAIDEENRRRALQQQVHAVAIVPFTVDATDPTASAAAEAIRSGAVAMLQTVPEAVVVEGQQKNAHEFGATVRSGPTGLELVGLDRSSGVTAPPVPAVNAGSAAAAFAQWVMSQAKLRGKLGLSSDADALASFASGVRFAESGDKAKAGAALKLATQKDPSFLAAQIFALDFFTGQQDYASAIDAGQSAAALAPDDIEVVRRLARVELAAAKPEDAITLYKRILAKKSSDPEAVGVLARYALGVGDDALYSSLAAKASPADPATTVHDGDLLFAQSKFDQAVEKYYGIEANVSNNPVLSLKIGRIAVLRHSLPIADLELKKLKSLDPSYGTPLLEAYMAAENHDGATAEAKLNEASGKVDWRNDFFTSSAEIYAILNQPAKTIDALKRATAKGEPTAAYILSNPLFSYLSTEPEFAKVRSALVERQGSIRARLSAS